MRKSVELSDSISHAVGLSRSIREIVIGNGVLSRVPELIRRYYVSGKAFIVGDENTFGAAGRSLERILADAGIPFGSFVFPAEPYLKSSVENAESFLDRLRESAAVPVAVGSGVINDLVKYAAFQLKRPYLCVATAASMDGYASAGSPLSQQGFKHTIQCAPPPVIVADIDIIAAAPPAMAGWGYGDLCGKVPAGADWLIADSLGIEPLDSVVWPLVQHNLKSWINDPEGVASGQSGAINNLLTGLVLSSIAMELHASSRPASGADHQIAHKWEMDGLKTGSMPVSHGTCVALATLDVLSLYRWLLQQDFSTLDVDRVIRERRQLSDLKREVDEYFPSRAVAGRACLELEAKFVDDAILHERLGLVKKCWPELRKRLVEFLSPYQTIKADLKTAGVQTDPAAVGISREYQRQTIMSARLIRRRYTILDLLEETNSLDRAVDELFPLD
jgi:glycerol-1-phosphate dehydrogenase [NAD(P)+]